MNLNLTELAIALGVVNGLANVALGLTVWLRKPGVDAARAVDDLREQSARQAHELAKRLTAVETHIEHMPTSEEHATLGGTVSKIDERTEGLSEAVATIRTTLARIETFLLNTKS